MPTRTKAQHRADTTEALVTTARTLFAERGYAHVSLAEVVGVAGVSKGALYHYFDGKDDLFRAVLALVHAEVADRVAAVGSGADAWSDLVAGCTAFLTAATDPAVVRILLVDAPAVLGWDRWRELDARASQPHLVEALRRLIVDGEIAAQPVAPLAHLLSGAMNEAAAWLAGSPDRERDLADAVAALGRLLGGLRARP